MVFEHKLTRAQGMGERLLLIFQETFEVGCDSAPRTLNRDEGPNVDSFRVVIFYFV